ncbi:NAD(P)-dependent oxidoreductase [Candidatus Uhrbacteria bacterium]|nr:NAD(P)-dependent oxidoreductase [Candidatus Uhrbacteria bacterium]
MGKNVLVVGGAGFIGGAVTDLLLLAQQHSVRVYDTLLFEDYYHKPLDFVRGDIRDHEQLQKHLDWADVVIWLAALVADGACDLTPDLALEFNDRSVQWLSEHFDGRIIFPSSCLVYKMSQGVLDESSAVDPSTMYTKTKYSAEDYLKNKNAVVFRLSTLFGIGDAYSRVRLDLVVNLLTAKAAVDHSMTIFGGRQSRPFVHVRDVAQAMVGAVDSSVTGLFNLHTQNMTILDLAKKVAEHVPDASLDVQEKPLSETGDYRMNSDKARGVLGFQPRYTLDDGIKQVLEVIHRGRVKDIHHPRYSNERFLKINPLT